MQWGAWGGVGMAIAYNLLPRIIQSGLGVLLPHRGLQALENVMQMTFKLPSQLVVSPFDWERLMAGTSHVYAVGHSQTQLPKSQSLLHVPIVHMTGICRFCKLYII